jgi:hypothetical protein
MREGSGAKTGDEGITKSDLDFGEDLQQLVFVCCILFFLFSLTSVDGYTRERGGERL